MAVEDFTTYTEADPNSRVAVTSTRVTWADLTISEAAYVYIDKGANFFSGNFIHFLTVLMTSGTDDGEAYCWALTNSVALMRAIDVGNGDYLSVFVYNHPTNNIRYIKFEECDGGSLYGDTYNIAYGTPYYLTIVRDEAVGTYGTIYIYIYDDAGRTNLIDTLSMALHSSKKDYRYIFALNSLGAGTTQKTSGYAENLILENWGEDFSTSSPSVTTQATTAIAATTATGNGNVTALGNPPATQHGHVWATHANPTTADSKTENGVPSATGAFTSSITGLKQNTPYYTRAYIYYNSTQVFYGKQAYFTTLPDVPIVTTNPVTEIAATTALGNGSIDNNGGSAVTQHGMLWRVAGAPDIDTYDGITEEGATDDIGEFTSLMTELTAATTYHVRAYATNDEGTGYGADRTFVSGTVGAPIVTTERTTNVEPVSALGNGTIVSEGGRAITQHGHCWDETVNPTITDSSSGFWGKTTNGAGSVGAFTSLITGLTAGQEYYIRAYATNTQGTSYGNNHLIGDLAEELRGNIAVKNEYVVYTDYNGTQRELLGAEF